MNQKERVNQIVIVIIIEKVKKVEKENGQKWMVIILMNPNVKNCIKVKQKRFNYVPN